MASLYMIDYSPSSQAPDKGGSLAGTGLSYHAVNLALAAGVFILKPAIERYFGLAVNEHTLVSLDNRKSLKAIFDAGHDILFPVLDGLSNLPVNPGKTAIATAVTLIHVTPTPVQKSQEQSTMAVLFGVFACMVLALVGTTLVVRYTGQETYRSGGSDFSASSDNGGSSPRPFSRDSTPPSDDSSDELFGSGGPPPFPILDLFYDGPTSRIDNAVDTDDEKAVGDMDGAPPPPPPSFPTPVEDGDALKNNLRWWSRSLVLSMIFLIINRLFYRYFKGHGKTQKKASTSTVSEWITVNKIPTSTVSDTVNEIPTPTVSERIIINEIPVNFITQILSVPSTTVKPVIKPTSSNLLPLVANKNLDASISALAVATASRHTKKITIAVTFILVVITCFILYPFFCHHLLDDHIDKIVNFFVGEETRLEAPGVAEITGSIDESTVTEEEIDEEDLPTGEEQHIATPSSTVLVATSSSVLSPAATGAGEKTNNMMETSFNHIVGAGDNTLVAYENASPLAVDLKDIFDASEDGIPFHEVFNALSFSSSSSDGIPVLRARSKTLINPLFRFPTTLKEKLPVNSGQDIKVLLEHVPETNIPVEVEQVQTVSENIPASIVVEKVSSTSNVDTASKENVPVVNIRAPARAKTLPSSATITKESLNPKAASFVPVASYIPVRRRPRQSSSASLSLHYCYSPPSPTRPGLSASMHAPSRQGLGASIRAPCSPPRRDSGASVHAPSVPPVRGLSASIHAPSSPPMRGLCAGIHVPCTPPIRVLNASIHAPSSPPPIRSLSASIHAPCTPPRRGLNASIHAPSSPPMRGLSASIHTPCPPPKRDLNIHASIGRELEQPFEPAPIPVIDLSPDRYGRRIIDPKREVDVVVLISSDAVS